MRGALFCGLISILAAGFSQAQVQIFPTRLTLTDQNVSGYLNLQNPSNEKQTFDLQLVHYKMRQDGGFERQKEIPANHPLVERLKFSPSQVTLNPSEKQVVRIMVTDLNGLPDGETYLHLQALPQKAGSPKSQTKGNFQLNARIAVAVPIVVRKGAVTVQPQIREARYRLQSDGGLQLKFQIQKKGEGFLVGDLEILQKKSQSEELITMFKGLASYIDDRSFGTTLSSEEMKKFPNLNEGSLIYRFKSNSDSGQAFSLEGTLSPETESKETKPGKGHPREKKTTKKS